MLWGANMCHKTKVGISEFRVARAPKVLVTYGLGSCLAITLYDAGRRSGGLAHTLLPAVRFPGTETRETKYVDRAIALMVAALLEQGASREQLTAKIFGGANMFEPAHRTSLAGIGARNAESARRVLQGMKIPLLAEDVGGNYGRTVTFDLDSGRVEVSSVHVSENNKIF